MLPVYASCAYNACADVRQSTVNKPPSKDTFLGFVQQHERLWGMESYPGRPDLEAILAAPVVAFWVGEVKDAPRSKTPERYTVTLHNDLADVERYITSLVLRLAIELPKRRLARLFVKGAEVRIKGVQVVFEKIEN
jgi:hypothetical protein